LRSEKGSFRTGTGGDPHGVKDYSAQRKKEKEIETFYRIERGKISGSGSRVFFWEENQPWKRRKRVLGISCPYIREDKEERGKKPIVRGNYLGGQGPDASRKPPPHVKKAHLNEKNTSRRLAFLRGDK